MSHNGDLNAVNADPQLPQHDKVEEGCRWREELLFCFQDDLNLSLTSLSDVMQMCDKLLSNNS